MANEIQKSKNPYVVIDPIEYAEKELDRWNTELNDMASKLKESEGYIQGVSTMLKSMGKDPEGSVGKMLWSFQQLLLGFYNNSAQTCDALKHSVSMVRNLRIENKFLRNTLTTILAINPEAQNGEIELKAKGLGEFYEEIIRHRKLREEADKFREEHR